MIAITKNVWINPNPASNAIIPNHVEVDDDPDG